MKKFKELLRISFKSEDTEEWLDVWFTRPIGLVFALLWNKLGVHPNAITILSILLGIAAGWMFHYSDLTHNIYGVVLLMLANFCDSTDGQMARITGKKTLVGRMLDGFASNVWFFSIYVAISVRLMNDPMPFIDMNWGILIWILCTAAGIYGHARPCALADYYRQIHLYFLLGQEGSELNTYYEQHDIYEKARREHDYVAMAFYYNYANYCHGQEQRTPKFQEFICWWKDQPEEEIRQEFLKSSRPLMPYTNILTHNTRATVLFISALINIPWLYPLFELTVLQGLMVWLNRRHEALCERLIEKYMEYPKPTELPILFDFGGTLDTHGTHWGKMFWHAYQQQGVGITEEQLRQAYVYAERMLGQGNIIKEDFTFRRTLEEKLRLQLQFLRQEQVLQLTDEETSQLLDTLLNSLYKRVCQNMEESCQLIKELFDWHLLGIVTNFYGNIETVLREFGLKDYIDEIIESAKVGVRKPDPQIFRKAAKRFAPKPERMMVVGDSYEKDILPAKQVGFQTVWLKGEGWNEAPADTSAADYVITDLKQLKEI
ncbi:MAG: HAD-IA family hydrolase [Prevotella sp.]|nr:HAD-IA family hydrolase [Prevotella sp.]